MQAVNEPSHGHRPPDDGARVLLAQSDTGGDAAAAEVAAIGGAASRRPAPRGGRGRRPGRGRAAAGGSAQVLTALEKLGTTHDRRRLRAADAARRPARAASSRSPPTWLTIGVVGHAGDGNMHPTVVFDGQDPDAVGRGRGRSTTIMAFGLELGGTITGEHGVGMLKMDGWSARSATVSLRVHRAIKERWTRVGAQPRQGLHVGAALRRARHRPDE